MTQQKSFFERSTIPVLTRKVVATAALLLAAACGKDATGPNGGGDGDGGGGGGSDLSQLIVKNNLSTLSIAYVYTWECSAQPNQIDRLGPNELIRPGNDRVWEVQPACYHTVVLTRATDTEPQRRYENEFTVAAGRSLTLSINESSDGDRCSLHCPIE